ncbi:MAG TPA: hypothetical protein VF492_06340, partial [Verrucomicrobiae bacterium]
MNWIARIFNGGAILLRSELWPGPAPGARIFGAGPDEFAFTSFAKLFIAPPCVQKARQFQPKTCFPGSFKPAGGRGCFHQTVTAMAMEPVDQDNPRPVDDGRKPGPPFPKDGKLFVISLRSGRLANRLTLFAQFIALAEEQGHRIINFAFHSYAHLFETTR